MNSFPSMKVTMLAVMMAYASAPVTAFSEEKSVEIDKVEVRGILPEKLESVPGSFNIVDEKELEARRPFSIKEALNTTPGVHIVGEDSFGFGLNIGVRGLNPRRTSRTLLLEDGMPLFLAPYGDPSAHYSTPLDRVQRIEVVKGSGQILYGPQTLGGMINFVTRPIPKEGVLGSVTATLGNNDFGGLHANIGAGGERGGVMLDAIKKKGDGVRDNHEFDVEEYTLKGQLNINERHTFMAKVGYYKEDSNISETALGAVEYAEDKFQAPTGNNDTFEHERKTVQLQHIFDINDSTRLTTQAYYVDSFRTSFRQINAPGGNNGRSQLERCPAALGGNNNNNLALADGCGGRHRPRDYNYWGVEPRLDFKHNLFGIESDAVIGMRYHEEDIHRQQYRGDTADFQSLTHAKNNSLPREDIQIDVKAKSYYAQNTFNIGNWALTPGVRIEDMQVKTAIARADGAVQTGSPGANLTNNQTEVLPGFGVAWNGIANTTVFAGVHKGMAPPRPDRDITANGANTARVSGTSPEISTNWELGVRSKYFKGVSFESTLFHNQIDDIVVGQNGIFINGGDSEMTGVEFAGRVDFGTIYDTAHNFYILGSYTNLFTAKFKTDVAANNATGQEAIESGNRLPYAPRDLASINFGYQHPIGLDARIGVDYVSQQYVDGLNTRVESLNGLQGTVPAYTLLNASLNFKPVGSKFTYFMSGHNLADKEYLVSRVDGKVAGRQRQVFAGVRFDF